MRRRIHISVVAGLALVVVALLVLRPWQTTESQRLTNVSVRLPIPVVDMAFGPYYLGSDEGIFSKHGLNVSLEPGSAELNPAALVAQGVDNFGILGGPELLLRARAKGLPLVGIALLHVDSDFVVLVSLKERNITHLRQLEGRSVGFFHGHISTDVLHMLLNDQNVTVNEVDVGFNYEPLLTGTVDAEWAFRTTAGLFLPARGVPINMISPASYGIHTDGHVLITSEAMISDHPDQVQAFVSALIESVEAELARPEDAIRSARRRDPQLKVQTAEQQLAVYHPSIRRNRRIGQFPAGAVARALDQMQRTGVLTTDINPEQAFTNRFVDEHFR